jgi:hypothetical protein
MEDKDPQNSAGHEANANLKILFQFVAQHHGTILES